jgi:ABC-type transport system substrate-binding protein
VDGIIALFMNLARPPFDDVHVRRAMNLAIDKGNIDRLYSSNFGPATHLISKGVEDNVLVSYDPYDVGHGPRLPAAREEMAASRYDRDGDGRCDARACRGIPFPAWDFQQWPIAVRYLEDSLRPLGIRFDTEFLPFERWVEVAVPQARPPVILTGWQKDYHNASTYFLPLFYGPEAGGLNNTSMVGASRQTLARLGYRVRSVPSIDAKIEQCVPLVGSDQATCWAEADKLLMERVVPAVPLVVYGDWKAVSRRVARFSWDQSLNYPALDRFVLVPGEG